MDTFNYKKYIAEGRLYEDENIISEISDADIIKAVAKTADISPKELVAKAKEDKVEESFLTYSDLSKLI